MTEINNPILNLDNEKIKRILREKKWRAIFHLTYSYLIYHRFTPLMVFLVSLNLTLFLYFDRRFLGPVVLAFTGYTLIICKFVHRLFTVSLADGSHVKWEDVCDLNSKLSQYYDLKPLSRNDPYIKYLEYFIIAELTTNPKSIFNGKFVPRT